ncbi:MAG TPA: hypothetical protein VFH54_14820 [Mycobacteriales bacterium]|nr:hypothetical protein [Mycobacteriales bacterium]
MPSESTMMPGLAGIALTAAVATQVGMVPVAPNPHVSTAIGTGANGTLDLCGGTFRSEAMRVERYQEFFVDPNQPQREVESNEIVRYQPGGTAQAYREVQAAARGCRAVTVQGTRVSAARVQPRDPRLAADQLTVLWSQTSANITVWRAAVYQYRGDLFDGIYVNRQTKQQALNDTKALAEAAAQVLTRAT